MEPYRQTKLWQNIIFHRELSVGQTQNLEDCREGDQSLWG
jgi:hypothetical protein